MDPKDALVSNFFKEHSGELLIFSVICFLLIALMIALPQLLRVNLRKADLWHAERMKAIEQGMPPPPDDEKSRLAGRIAMLVPIVVMTSAATVTSFLVVYKSENIFAVSLGIWVVAGIVSLAALTSGVALMARLNSLPPEEADVPEDERHESSYMN